MSENKEVKKGFWGSLFNPKKKSSCCCNSQVKLADAQPATTASCYETENEDGAKVIKVLGTGCSSCKALYNTVQEAVAQLGINAKVEKEEDLEKIMSYNVMSLPALVVDGKVIAKGQKLSIEQVKSLLK